MPISMRVIRRTNTVAGAPFNRAQVVQQQKRIDIQPVGGGERAANREAAPLEGFVRSDHGADVSCLVRGHNDLRADPLFMLAQSG